MTSRWGQIDASAYMHPGSSPADNRAGLYAAYNDAKAAKAALYIPAGTYAIELARPPESGSPTAIALTDAPIIGAGSSVTILKFEYPESGIAVDKAFMTDQSVLAGDPPFAYARIEGLQLVGPDTLGGTAADGSDAPDCWAIYVSDSTMLRMIDVRTSLWKEAVRLDGVASGTAGFLERCHIRSRSTRIRRLAPSRTPEWDLLTLVNCTIEQDDDGFSQDATGTLHCGIQQDASARLTVIGGASLGGRSHPYDLRQPPAVEGGPLQVSVSDHYFGPNSRVGIHLSSTWASVQVDNCTFHGETGIVLDGERSVYHISNCAFVGGRSSPAMAHELFAEPARSYFGSAVRDSDAGFEVEAWFSNCKFGSELGALSTSSNQSLALSVAVASSYENTVVRHLGKQSRPWQFSNCMFCGLRNPAGALFKAADGLNQFRECNFLDEREEGTYPLEQHAGRIELHACRKVGRQPVFFSSESNHLHVVLNQNVFRQDSVLVVPTALVTLRGAENEFGDYVEVRDPGGWFAAYGSVPVSSDLQLKRGQGPRRAERWSKGKRYYTGDVVRNGDSPERVYECTDSGRTDDGPTGTASAISDGGVTWAYVRDDADYEYLGSPRLDVIEHIGDTRDQGLPVIPIRPDPYQLIISWNADWVEFDEYGNPTIHLVNMRSRLGGAYCNPLVGATVRIFAIQDFTLGSAGNIAMRWSSRHYPTGEAATLRYSALEGKWVLV